MKIRTDRTLRLRGWGTLVLVAMIVAPAWGAIFTDIAGLPSQRAIERLAAKGIFKIGGDKFTPAGTVPRGEFAVLLARVLGASGQGVPVPAFKDAAEIPKEMLPAVAAITNLGSVSPVRAEVRKGALIYVLTTDKPVYGPTDNLELRFTISNTGATDVKFEFANSQFFDFVIKNADGVEVAQWSLGRAFLPMSAPITLAAGKAFDYATQWKQLDQNDEPVPPGRYELIAVQTTKQDPTTLSLALYRGALPAYPDNTFRPKTDISRLDLAAVIVRAMGLGESPSQPPAVSDATEIPTQLRGTVGVAIEKGLVPVGPDRTFRPAQPATRADVAWALDKLMESLRRYDFSKGMLKDIRVGTPTLMVIEELNKAQRTFRVARSNAVYRNNAVAELKDLQPGDTLLFLKVGDVGDVAYIEATGK
jgi:hypothetical protein